MLQSSLPNVHRYIFDFSCLCAHLAGEGECDAWMERTIIHQSFLPPLPSSSLANAFAKDILFTPCDLFSTDKP